jgi:outer membrane autotransporter protein
MAVKGSRSLSGGVLFSYASNSIEGKDYKAAFQSGISYFFIDNLELGINLQLGYAHQTKIYVRTTYGYPQYLVNDSRTLDTRYFDAGPLIAYYFGNGKYKPFISVSCLYNYVSFTQSGSFNDDNIYSTLTTILEAGYLIPVGKKIAVTPLIQYQKTNFQQTRHTITSFGEIAPNEETISFGAQLKMFL